MMTEERIAKLTSAVYKVTDLFPEKEPLKFVMRRESLDVLFSYVVLVSKSTFEQKEKSAKKAIVSSKSLVHYFSLAESQNWVDSKNFSILKTEYSNLIFWLEDQLLDFENDVKKTFNSGNYYVEGAVPELKPRTEIGLVQDSLEKENETISISPHRISGETKLEKARAK
ncbi:hypothetical protein M0Q03_03850, partial [bacterium]|nr:hypothetical protein [bacterium]